MTQAQSPAPQAGTCWFCNRERGTSNSLVLPFWSQQASDVVHVLVLPRCDACFELHHRQMMPSGLIIVGCAILTALPFSLLPLPESIRGVVMFLATLGGFATGIYFTANREAREAKARGSRPMFDYVQHPPYNELAANHAAWRQNRSPGIGDGSSTRRETVDDYRIWFGRLTREPEAMAALIRGCIEAGLDPVACKLPTATEVE